MLAFSVRATFNEQPNSLKGLTLTGRILPLSAYARPDVIVIFYICLVEKEVIFFILIICCQQQIFICMLTSIVCCRGNSCEPIDQSFSSMAIWNDEKDVKVLTQFMNLYANIPIFAL
ncbi:hypothetical protein SAMN05428978_1009106 [Nitrosomonas sp. Nm34]|nr:hypothetical protein SAMN05428978_1009106 [Nitrosomonas sp. Nm34]